MKSRTTLYIKIIKSQCYWKKSNASSGKRTRHINIRYFFVADRIEANELTVEYCPTSEMTGEFFIKLRGIVPEVQDTYP